MVTDHAKSKFLYELPVASLRWIFGDDLINILILHKTSVCGWRLFQKKGKSFLVGRGIKIRPKG